MSGAQVDRRRQCRRTGDDEPFLIARKVFEFRVSSAEFFAQSAIGRVHLVPFLVHGESEKCQKNGISSHRYCLSETIEGLADLLRPSSGQVTFFRK